MCLGFGAFFLFVFPMEYWNDRYTFPSLNSMLTCFDRCYWEHCCQFRGGIILFSWRWQSNEGVWCSQLWYDQHAETWVSCSVLDNAYLGLWWEVILCRRQVNSLTFFFLIRWRWVHCIKQNAWLTIDYIVYDCMHPSYECSMATLFFCCQMLGRWICCFLKNLARNLFLFLFFFF